MVTEQRLIDANALSDKVDESKYDNPHPQGMIRVNHRNEHDHFLRMILDAPTVDAVEVVRCFECQKEGTEECPMAFRDCLTGCLCANTKGTDFCSYGERRTT